MRAAILTLLLGVVGCESQAGTAQTSASQPSGSASASASSAAPSSTSAGPPPSARLPPVEWKALAKAWHHPSPIPSFELVNQDGETFRLNRLGDGYVLLGFIFTTCGVPKACPLTTQKMYEVGKLWAAREKAGKTGDRKLHLLTLTIDPENDTPAVLKSYGSAMRKDVPDWTFATGPEELMQEALPEMFGAHARRDGQGSIAHTVKAALLAPGLRPIQDWENNVFDPKEVIDLVMK